MRNSIRFLYAYNQWANNRILDACAGLSNGQFTAGQGYSTPGASIRDTLVHTMGTEETWLNRWGGISPAKGLDPADFATLALIRSYWEQLGTHVRGFLDALDDDLLDKVIEYTNYQGEPRAYPLWQMMLHQVNHATQHRSELAVLLTAQEHSPGNLDLVVYMDATKK